MNRKINITQPPAPESEVPAEVIATAILEIATAIKAIGASRLTRRAVIALVHDNSRIPKKTIEIVLNNLETLQKTWLK